MPSLGIGIWSIYCITQIINLIKRNISINKNNNVIYKLLGLIILFKRNRELKVCNWIWVYTNTNTNTNIYKKKKHTMKRLDDFERHRGVRTINTWYFDVMLVSGLFIKCIRWRIDISCCIMENERYTITRMWKKHIIRWFFYFYTRIINAKLHSSSRRILTCSFAFQLNILSNTNQ